MLANTVVWKWNIDDTLATDVIKHASYEVWSYHGKTTNPLIRPFHFVRLVVVLKRGLSVLPAILRNATAAFGQVFRAIFSMRALKSHVTLSLLNLSNKIKLVLKFGECIKFDEGRLWWWWCWCQWVDAWNSSFEKKGQTVSISTPDVNKFGNLWSMDNRIKKSSCAII